jgi:moderate conductance mechanosensitive channel
MNEVLRVALEQIQLEGSKPQTWLNVLLVAALGLGIWRLGKLVLSWLGIWGFPSKVLSSLRWVWYFLVLYGGASVLVFNTELTALEPLYSQGDTLTTWFGASIGRILGVVALAYVAWWGSEKLIARIVPSEDFNRRNVRAVTLKSIVGSTLRVVIVVIAALEVLQSLGLNTAALLAGVSILGVAVSFGAQSLIRDVLSGFFVLLEDQYGVGDVITVNGNPALSGGVERLTLRVTQIRAQDGVVHIVPNGQITSVSVASKDWSRWVGNVMVAYHSEVDLALGVVNQVAQDLYNDPQWNPIFLEEPRLEGVTALDLAGMQLRVLFKVQPKEQWRLGREFNYRIKKALEGAGIAALE